MKTDISFKLAFDTVISRAPSLKPEKVTLDSALFRVCASDVRCGYDIPTVDNSAMDGYAVRASDTARASAKTPVLLEVTGVIKAGERKPGSIRKGLVKKIMTGAAIPRGADAVIRIEDVEESDGAIRVVAPVRLGKDIRRKGEDVRKGSFALKKGDIITPARLGMAINAGMASLRVSPKLRVAVIATGDELARPGSKLHAGMVFECNAHTISAQVAEAGAVPVNLGIARDSMKDLRRKLRKALACDIAIFSGGISMGDYDLVKNALDAENVSILFWKVRMRPGRPFAFGVKGRRCVFCLPGNPVSSMVCFEELVRPFILKSSGAGKIFRTEITATASEDLDVRRGERFFLRGILDTLSNRPLVSLAGSQGSGILTTMGSANCIIIIPENRGPVKKGETVRVQMLNAREG